MIQQKSKKNCQICLETFQILYSLADCNHQFCKNCCLAYINESANNFSMAKCLGHNCGRPLKQTKAIYSMVDDKIKIKLQKFTNYKNNKTNTKLQGCKKPDCQGHFLKKDSKHECPECKSKHCPRCWNLSHPGQCLVDTITKQMRRLKYQRCPACGVWAERVNGCKLIDCPCGQSYCYLCGRSYQQDQCKYIQIYQIDDQIRNQIEALRCENIVKNKNAICFYAFFPLKIFIILLATMLFGVTAIILLGVALIVVAVIAPLVLMAETATNKIFSQCKKTAIIITLILIYPLLIASMAFYIILACLLYPCIKNTQIGRNFIVLEIQIAKIFLIYIQGVHKIMYCF